MPVNGFFGGGGLFSACIVGNGKASNESYNNSNVVSPQHIYVEHYKHRSIEVLVPSPPGTVVIQSEQAMYDPINQRNSNKVYDDNNNDDDDNDDNGNNIIGSPQHIYVKQHDQKPLSLAEQQQQPWPVQTVSMDAMYHQIMMEREGSSTSTKRSYLYDGAILMLWVLLAVLEMPKREYFLIWIKLGGAFVLCQMAALSDAQGLRRTKLSVVYSFSWIFLIDFIKQNCGGKERKSKGTRMKKRLLQPRDGDLKTIPKIINDGKVQEPPESQPKETTLSYNEDETNREVPHHSRPKTSTAEENNNVEVTKANRKVGKTTEEIVRSLLKDSERAESSSQVLQEDSLSLLTQIGSDDIPELTQDDNMPFAEVEESEVAAPEADNENGDGERNSGSDELPSFNQKVLSSLPQIDSNMEIKKTNEGPAEILFKDSAHAESLLQEPHESTNNDDENMSIGEVESSEADTMVVHNKDDEYEYSDDILPLTNEVLSNVSVVDTNIEMKTTSEEIAEVLFGESEHDRSSLLELQEDSQLTLPHISNDEIPKSMIDNKKIQLDEVESSSEAAPTDVHDKVEDGFIQAALDSLPENEIESSSVTTAPHDATPALSEGSCNDIDSEMLELNSPQDDMCNIVDSFAVAQTDSMDTSIAEKNIQDANSQDESASGSRTNNDNDINGPIPDSLEDETEIDFVTQHDKTVDDVGDCSTDAEISTKESIEYPHEQINSEGKHQYVHVVEISSDASESHIDPVSNGFEATDPVYDSDWLVGSKIDLIMEDQEGIDFPLDGTLPPDTESRPVRRYRDNLYYPFTSMSASDAIAVTVEHRTRVVQPSKGLATALVGNFARKIGPALASFTLYLFTQRGSDGCIFHHCIPPAAIGA